MCKYLPHSELSTAYSVKQNESQGPTEAPSPATIMSFNAPWRLRLQELWKHRNNYCNRPKAAALHLYSFLWENKQCWSASISAPPAETIGARWEVDTGGRQSASLSTEFPLDVQNFWSCCHEKQSALTWKQTPALVHNLRVGQTKSDKSIKTTVETFEILDASVSLLQDKASVNWKEKLNRINSLHQGFLSISCSYNSEPSTSSVSWDSVSKPTHSQQWHLMDTVTDETTTWCLSSSSGGKSNKMSILEIFGDVFNQTRLLQCSLGQ